MDAAVSQALSLSSQPQGSDKAFGLDFRLLFCVFLVAALLGFLLFDLVWCRALVWLREGAQRLLSQDTLFNVS